jgi:nucleotide-binding universal stress UspA family protein
MKKLLIPTDFSDNAATALDFAIDLANRYSSSITVIHSYHLASTATVMVSVEEMMREDAEAEMAVLLDQIRPRLQNGATVEGKVVRGDAVGCISRTASAGDYDLIIMSTQGATGLKEVFSGSTANGVIKHAETPVLAIPSGFQFQALDSIIFAVDEGGLSSPAPMAALLAIAKAYQAKVRVYHKDTGEDDKGIDPTIDMFLESVEHSFHYELDTDKIHDSLSDFAEDYKADLLCMIRRKRSFLERVFHSSATTREVFQIRIPMLVLHDDAE